MTTTIAALQNEVLNLKNNMDAIQRTMESLTDKIKVLTEAEEFDVFIQQELIPYFGDLTSANIVKVLQKCRTENNNYLHFTPVYQWKSIYGDLQKRQLLKLVSAVYRVKYLPKTNNNVATLRSDIKYAKACPECGKIASALYDRLVKEGKM
jgi:hypothetical protein